MKNEKNLSSESNKLNENFKEGEAQMENLNSKIFKTTCSKAENILKEAGCRPATQKETMDFLYNSTAAKKGKYIVLPIVEQRIPLEGKEKFLEAWEVVQNFETGKPQLASILGSGLIDSDEEVFVVGVPDTK